VRQRYLRFIIINLAILNFMRVYSADTLCVNNASNKINIYQHIAIFEDRTRHITIDSIFTHPGNYGFKDNKSGNNLNFGYSTSTFWVKLIIKNVSPKPINFIIEVSNPDLDNLGFFAITDHSITKKIETGELHDVSTREIYDRNFLSEINLNPGVTTTYYISVNNGGHPIFIPISLKEKTAFEISQKKTELLYWFINGLLIFIFFFNIYLYTTNKDRVNLYYSLYVFFATLTLLSYDGYFYFFNPPVFAEKIKWLNPSLYIVFLLSFTQLFTSYNTSFKWQTKLLNPFKVLAIVFVLFYSLPYPYSLVADVGIPILILASLILIIVISSSALKLSYTPSILLFLAYCSVFLGFAINQFKEMGIIYSGFFAENSSKFGQALECILLAVAVLERFRINQKNDKQTIHDNLSKIALQNRELEIINTELEKLSIVASETDNSIAIYDNDGRLEWGNTGFEKLYEVNINELIKKKRDKIENIIPNENIHRYIGNCRDSQLPVVFETPVITKNRNEIWVQTTLSPFIRQKKIFKIIAIDSDITSLKNYGRELEIAKEKAEESDRLKTAFLHNISHEIRTPMNAIIGFSGLLNDEHLETDKRTQYTDIIIQSSNHLLSVINDIMRIASIEAGQENVAETRFDLNSTLEYLHEQFWLKAREQHTDLLLKVNIPSTDIEIISDETKLVQVLANLIDNALKFTKKGSVTFGYTIQGDELQFFVEDTGIGIDPRLHEEIFKRFHQVESTNTRKFGGSGLGLSISKAYVEILGGRIWLSSELNKGSVFYFTIPFKLAETNTVAADNLKVEDSLTGNSKKTLLIAEDEDSNFNLLREQLSELDLQIVRAKNGLEAVEMCKSRIIDLVLMDIKMPVMDGLTATQKIREFMPELPIVAQTAYNTASDREKAFNAGCVDFFSKPLKQEVILSAVKTYLFKV
jgi:PAS domain S-box-containing protein